MKNNCSIKRRGFTLVELLIVIVVIGVLSAMMMLSSTEAVSSAKASNIISNLRNWKTAALAWYADHLDTADASGFALGNTDKKSTSKDIGKYLNSENAPGYDVQGSIAGTWYVIYDGADAKNSSVVDKLNSRRSSVGIAGTATSKDYSNTGNAITTSTGKVYMYVR